MIHHLSFDCYTWMFFFPLSQWQNLTSKAWRSPNTLTFLYQSIFPIGHHQLIKMQLPLSQVTTASEKLIIPNHTNTLILPQLFSFVTCTSLQLTTMSHPYKESPEDMEWCSNPSSCDPANLYSLICDLIL